MSSEDSTTANSAGPTPPASAPASPKPEPPRPYEVSTEKAFLEAIKPIPIVGPWLVVVFRKWGWRGLLLVSGGFIAGGVLVTGLFMFGVMPGRILPDKYKTPVVSPNATPGKNEAVFKPHGDLPVIEVPDDNKWQVWINDYLLRFQRETDRFEPDQNRRTNVLVLKEPFAQDTATFTWQLDVDSDHTCLLARGFRVTNAGLIDPLQVLQGCNPTGTNLTQFKVSPGTKGDVLVAIVSTITREGSQDRVPVFHSSAP